MQAPVRFRVKLSLLAGDLALLSGCIVAGSYIRRQEIYPLFGQYSTAWVLCLLIYPLCFYITRSYEVQPEASSTENLRRPLLGQLIAASAASLIFFFAPDIRFGRGIFAIANALYALVLLAWRFAVFARLRRRSLSVLLMGDPDSMELARQLIREYSPNSQTEQWQPKNGEENGTSGLDHLNQPAEENPYDLLILAGHVIDPTILRKAASMRLKGIMVWNLPRLWAEFAERLPVRLVDERWVATAEGFRSLNEQSFQVTKRLLDICFASLGLVFGAPVVLVSAILIKIQDGGPVLYSQGRVGKGERIFRVHKLRTMVKEAEGMTGPVWAAADDPRITRVGHWLRKLRIDEIPQMWNVLRGEMSFVGPRPERPVFVKALKSKYPVYSLRHLVRPGITGWAQVCCPYAANEEDNLLKLEYDLYYLQNASILFDLRIFLRTISTVASGSGSR
jgi:exopolysaccharide biosynthesis polyprenyl glycosylphosphotransferase